MDALSITPPGGATDSIRWAMPTCFADGGVTARPGTDVTGDHLAGVQAHPQPQVHTVAILDLDRKPLRLLLNAQGRQAGANSVVFQRDWRAEHRHDAVAGELTDRAAVALHHRRAAVQPVRT